MSMIMLYNLLDILFNIHAKSRKQKILSDVKELLTEKLGYKDIGIEIEKEFSEPSLVVLYGRAQ